jgi:hypothetical protein
MSDRYDQNYRLATDIAAITRSYLSVRGIPAPDTIKYTPYATRVNLTDGGQALRGFSGLVWQWNELIYKHAFWIASRVRTAVLAGTPLYLTADLGAGGIGEYTRNAWADVSGTPWPIDLNPAPETSNLIINDFILQLKDIAIVNATATGVILL